MGVENLIEIVIIEWMKTTWSGKSYRDCHHRMDEDNLEWKILSRLSSSDG
ncbi:hypothetical protein [Sutcliffiella horikoshii]|nr:hypothetical protein [Sutcliffiella horikoshii]